MSLKPINVGGTRVTLTPNNNSVPGNIPENARQVRVYNGLSVVVFLETAASAAEASASSTAIAPGAIEIFSLDTDHTSIAAYSTGSGSVYLHFGFGF